MALNQEHEFIDAEEEIEARRAVRRISLVSVIVAFVFGFGLVSLLLYGRTLMDDGKIIPTPPAAITAPETPPPTPTAPSPSTP